MEVSKQPQLAFNGVDIVNVNVQVQDHAKRDASIPANLTVNPKVFFPADSPNEFVIIIEASISKKDSFIISLVAFGFFIMPGLIGNIRDQKPFININAPAIMFPYVRSFISTLTANLGPNFPPVLIPPHFFQGDLSEHVEPEKSEVNK